MLLMFSAHLLSTIKKRRSTVKKSQADKPFVSYVSVDAILKNINKTMFPQLSCGQQQDSKPNKAEETFVWYISADAIIAEVNKPRLPRHIISKILKKHRRTARRMAKSKKRK